MAASAVNAEHLPGRLLRRLPADRSPGAILLTPSAAASPTARTSTLRERALWIVRAYYWLAPGFLTVYVGTGIDLRFPFLDALPGASVAYYLAQTACALVVTRRPALTSLIGRAESSINIGLLVITTWTAWFRVLDDAGSAAGVIHNPFTPAHVASLVSSAIVLTISHVALQLNRR